MVRSAIIRSVQFGPEVDALKSFWASVVSLLLVGGTVGLAVPVPAYANAAPAVFLPEPGGLVVPTTTPDVRIDREVLHFDLTDTRGSALVRASYELANLADRPVSLDLLFVAPGGEDFSVVLDGRTLPVSATTGVAMPEAWTVNLAIDPVSGEEYRTVTPAVSARPKTWAFRLDLPARGGGKLEATYRARYGTDRARQEYMVRMVEYVLGPAKNWAGFGTLEVTILAPSDFAVASVPAIPRAENTGQTVRYSAIFQGVPADVLRISTIFGLATAPPDPVRDNRHLIALALSVLAACLVGLVSWLAASRLPWVWAAATAGAGLGYVATLLAAMYLAQSIAMPEPMTSELAGGSSYGQTFALLGWILWGVVILPGITATTDGVMAASAVSQRRRRRASQPTATPVA